MSHSETFFLLDIATQGFFTWRPSPDVQRQVTHIYGGQPWGSRQSIQPQGEDFTQSWVRAQISRNSRIHLHIDIFLYGNKGRKVYLAVTQIKTSSGWVILEHIRRKNQKPKTLLSLKQNLWEGFTHRFCHHQSSFLLLVLPVLLLLYLPYNLVLPFNVSNICFCYYTGNNVSLVIYPCELRKQ